MTSTSQLEKDGIPTFYIATNGTVCTHRMNESDIPVWCQSSEDAGLAMRSISNPEIHGDQIADPNKDLVNGAAELAKLTSSIATERDQLAAQNERFRSALTPNIVDWIHCGMATNGRLKEEWAFNQYKNLKLVIKESPIASVAEIQALAVNEFAQEVGVFDPEYDDQEYVEIPRYKILEYIESIRKQEQETGQ